LPSTPNGLGRLAILSRIVFAGISLMLMLIAAGLILYSIVQVFRAFSDPDGSIGRTLLDAVGFMIIAVAVFEVAKYILEEEVIEPTEMRHAGEARRSMTKFISTIAIAVFLEALVTIFQASKAPDLSNMLYPTILLFGGVAMMVGLGAYQRLSASAEADLSDPASEQKDPDLP
jgi:hypothetical protein